MKASDIISKLSKPAQRAIAGAGIVSLRQLSQWTEKEVAALHGVGPNAVDALKKELERNGLSFAAKR